MKDFSGEVQGSGVGGEEDAIGGDQFADDAVTMTPVNLQLEKIFRLDEFFLRWSNKCNFGIFRQQSAGANGGAGEAVYDFAGVDGAARNFFDVIPADFLQRFRQGPCRRYGRWRRCRRFLLRAEGRIFLVRGV